MEDNEGLVALLCIKEIEGGAGIVYVEDRQTAKVGATFGRLVFRLRSAFGAAPEFFHIDWQNPWTFHTGTFFRLTECLGAIKKTAMLRQIKPRNARSARAVAAKAPHDVENPKTCLFLRSTKCSELALMCLRDLDSLKRPLSVRFTKKNAILPFEDATSLEFFSEKNDCSLLVFGCHTKKRPHCLTFVRTFDYKVLDMLELYIDPDTLRTLSQFKGRKVAVGLKPMLCFAGTAFESPVPNKFTLAKSILLDFFKGPDVRAVDVEGLQYMICVSVGEEIDGEPAPKIYVRSYLIRTKRSGQKLPRVEIEEMGPRIDFRVGRTREADESVMKEALKRPKGTEPKAKKNIETDLIGDKVGRIHIGKQDLSNLQTRKMKGLKRARDLDVDMEEMSMLVRDDEEDLNGTNHEQKKVRL